ncbi:uncharacterized protein LOC107027636 [Solanum pennellii]|uniref:Uncharacterized protein LOC107027636 n=1 Tax=Solanum pennellii TaxID=28526 RepID=A0ABM1VH68_SOLPN|nr:uncharacterized protein LOC107027636 [Solanum pennellii]
MSQSVALKKKGSNLNKAQSPLKNMNFDMQYRSRTELANQFKIKREQLANERNDKVQKEHAPITHKRNNSKDFIPQQRKSKLVENKSVIQPSSGEKLGTSHLDIVKGQTKKSLFQSGESIQQKRIKLPMHNFRFHTPSKKGVTVSVYVTRETLGNAEVKRKSVIPSTSLDQFPQKQAIHIGDETKTDNHTVADDLVDQEEIDEDECSIDEEIDIDCSTEGILEAEKVRGKTTCKDIHARNLEERKEVTFDKGQAVGPTAKRPGDIPEDEFRQSIEYWNNPTFQRATNENNEETSNSEMFIGTRTKTGKEIQADNQVAIAELQNRQNSWENTNDAFTAVFGKEQPGRLRCYGRSVTTSSLKKDEEYNKLKRKHVNEITSLKEEMKEMREEVRHFLSIASKQPWIECLSAQVVEGQNPLRSFGSTHDPVLLKGSSNDTKPMSKQKKRSFQKSRLQRSSLQYIPANIWNVQYTDLLFVVTAAAICRSSPQYIQAAIWNLQHADLLLSITAVAKLESVADKATLLTVASKRDLFAIKATLESVADKATLLSVATKCGLFAFWLRF